MPNLSLTHISFGYNTHTVIDDIDLHIPAWIGVLISGPSGSGKTTLLRLMWGIYPPKMGDILIWDKPISPKNRILHYGFSFVDNEFFEAMTLEENITIFPHLNNLTVDLEWYDILIETFNIQSLIHTPISKLSAGQRERVGLIRALITKPKILILDEPWSHLDPDLQKKLGEFLRTYQQENNATLIVSSHGGLDRNLFQLFLEFHEDHTVSVHADTNA